MKQLIQSISQINWTRPSGMTDRPSDERADMNLRFPSPVNPCLIGIACEPAPGGGERHFARNTFSFEMLRSEEHTSELQSQSNIVCRLMLAKKHDTLTPVRSSLSAHHTVIY